MTKRSQFLAIGIIAILFFLFGFVTWLNGILIPYLKISCELSDFQSLLVAFVFYIAYTIMALPSAFVLEKIGFKNGMMLGLWIMAVGALIFIPAAKTREFPLFLTGLFIEGTGLAILQTASNPYITVLGPKESAARRISILGICNKLAGAIAPLILAYFILNDGDAFVQNLQNMNINERAIALDELATRVINPYITMSIVLFFMGLGIKFAPLPAIKNNEEKNSETTTREKSNLFQYPHLILGVIALFLYVGAEVVAGDTIIRYGISLGIDISTAKAFTSYTMLSMVVGYILGILFIPKYISQQKALLISAISGVLFSIGIAISSGMISVFFVALLGLSNALMWPAIWPLALSDVGKFLNKASALLIMAIAGGAVIPLLWGKFSDLYGAQPAYLLLIPIYLYISYYATKGYQLRTWRK